MNTIQTAKVSEGNTNHLLIPAVLGTIAGLIICAFLVIPGIVVTAIALSLFATTSGKEFNMHTGTYRSFTSLFGQTFGTWQSIPEYTEVHLKLFSENETRRLSFRGGDVELSNKTISYDLYLVQPNGNSLLFLEFMKYRHANAALEILSKANTVPAIDHIAEKMAANWERRRRN